MSDVACLWPVGRLLPLSLPSALITALRHFTPTDADTLQSVPRDPSERNTSGDPSAPSCDQKKVQDRRPFLSRREWESQAKGRSVRQTTDDKGTQAKIRGSSTLTSQTSTLLDQRSNAQGQGLQP